MAKIAYPQAAQKRSFKLSPLELLILGLIILGTLYILSMWFQSFNMPGQGQFGGGASNAEVEAALAAADRLEGKLNAFDQQLVAMSKRIDNWEESLKKAPAGQTLPALSERIVQLERKLASAGFGKDLKSRLTKLEERTTSVEIAESRISALDKREKALQQVVQNRLEKLEQDVSEPLKAQTRNETAMATLARRLENLEKLFDKKFIEQQKDQTKVGAYLEMLNSRLRNFETSGKQKDAATAKHDSGIDNRLAGLEERLVKGERGSQEVDKMLAYLAGQVGELKRSLANAPQTPSGPAPQPAPRAQTESQPAPPSKVQDTTRSQAAAPRAQTKLVRYQVRKGDTLYGIARRYKVKIGQIRAWNPKLKNRKYLYAKERLVLRLPVQP
jgi:LysM repeat protein/predicted  nucleic acid-binding Zn-ribbon protein